MKRTEPISNIRTVRQRTLARELGCMVLEKPFEIKPLIDRLVIGETQIDHERKLNNWFQQKLKKQL